MYSEENASLYPTSGTHESFIFKEDFKIEDPNKSEMKNDDMRKKKSHLDTGGPNLNETNIEIKDSIQWSSSVNNPIDDCKSTYDDMHSLFKELMQTHIVRSSSKLASIFKKGLFVENFCHFFPSGRGGFCEPRENNISLENFIKNLTLQSSRRFQGSEFQLYGYDIKNRQRMFKLSLLRANIKIGADSKAEGEAFGTLTDADLKMGCAYWSARELARKQHRKPPDFNPPGMKPESIRFIKNVSRVSSHLLHTADHAKVNRRHFYAMCYKYGKPTFWFTFNPRAHYSMRVHFLATGKILRVPPSAYARYKLLGEKPGASAIHFQRALKCAIEDILGWMSSLAGPSKKLGVLPLVEAFAGAIEYSSSLHGHFLVWCVGDVDILDRFNLHSLCEEHRSQKIPSTIDNIFLYTDEKSVELPEHDHGKERKEKISPENDSKNDLCESNISQDSLDEKDSMADEKIDVLLPLQSISNENKTGYVRKIQDNPVKYSHEQGYDFLAKNPETCEDCATKMSTFLDHFANFLKTFSGHDLPLEPEFTRMAESCPECKSPLKISNLKIVSVLRRRQKLQDPPILKCSKCDRTYGIRKQLKKALNANLEKYQFPLFPDAKKDIDALNWNCVNPFFFETDGKPFSIDQYNVMLAKIIFIVEMHDAKHRDSCFNHGGGHLSTLFASLSN